LAKIASLLAFAYVENVFCRVDIDVLACYYDICRKINVLALFFHAFMASQSAM